MTERKFRNSLNEKPDEELMNIVQIRRGYSEEFLHAAEQILVERGYEINSIEEDIAPEKTKKALDENEYFTYTPLVAGLVMLIGFIIITNLVQSYPTAFNAIKGYLVVIACDLIAIYWSYRLSRKYGFKTWRWVFASFFLGPITLIVLNLKIWITPVPKKKKST